MYVPYYLVLISRIQTIERNALGLLEKHNNHENVITICDEPIKKFNLEG
jgi:hypothetical protein